MRTTEKLSENPKAFAEGQPVERPLANEPKDLVASSGTSLEEPSLADESNDLVGAATSDQGNHH